MIDDIPFAVYGSSPTAGDCGTSYTNTGSCKVTGDARVIAKSQCLGKSTCDFTVEEAIIGSGSCSGTPKSFSMQAVCRLDTVVRDNSRVDLEFRAGYPNTNADYTKNLVIRARFLGYVDDIVQVSLEVMIFAVFTRINF